MTTAAAVPQPGQAGNARTIHLSEVLKRRITDKAGEPLGRLSDVVVRLRTPGCRWWSEGWPASGAARSWCSRHRSARSTVRPSLTSARLDLRRFRRRPREVLLRADVLSHRLIDVQAGRLIRAADLELRQRGGEWVLAGVDTSQRRHRLPGLSAAREPGQHPFRDWSRFDPLIGQTSSAGLRGPFGRIRRLKPAQIADLLEEASKEEETEILGEVHKDPELEADVFEELDEDLATRLPGARTDEDIAGVLARMRADDAADAIAELLPRRHFKNALRRLRDGSSWRRRACVGRGQGSTGEHGRHVRGSRRQSAGDRI